MGQYRATLEMEEARERERETMAAAAAAAARERLARFNQLVQALTAEGFPQEHCHRKLFQPFIDTGVPDLETALARHRQDLALRQNPSEKEELAGLRLCRHPGCRNSHPKLCPSKLCGAHAQACVDRTCSKHNHR